MYIDSIKDSITDYKCIKCHVNVSFGTLAFRASAEGYGPGTPGGVSGIGGISGGASDYNTIPGRGIVPGSYAEGVPTHTGIPGRFLWDTGSYVGGPGAPRSGPQGNAGAPVSYSGNPWTHPKSCRSTRSYSGLPVSYRSPGSSTGISGQYYPGAVVRSSIYEYGLTPKPYTTDYEAPDGQGGVQFKTESGDGNGADTGTYRYYDSQGLYRGVQYSSDEQGFRGTAQTNEPGVDGKENPADVEMIVEQTPPGVQDMYNPLSSVYGEGSSGILGSIGGVYDGRVSGLYPGSEEIGGARQPAPGRLEAADYPRSAYAPIGLGGVGQLGYAYAPIGIEAGSAYAPGRVEGVGQFGSAYTPEGFAGNFGGSSRGLWVLK